MVADVSHDNKKEKEGAEIALVLAYRNFITHAIQLHSSRRGGEIDRWPHNKDTHHLAAVRGFTYFQFMGVLIIRPK